MTRKDILVLQLREIRNEFADALADLTPEQMAARPIPNQNPIGWIVCHCLRNFNHFIYRPQTGQTLLPADPSYAAPATSGGHDPSRYAAFASYAAHDPTPDNPAPDFTILPTAVDEVFGACIGVVESLDEEAFDRPGPHWQHERIESTAANCVRVINHSNTHLRDIWMLRGALGDRSHFPVQTLFKKPNSEGGVFYVPDRETILTGRKG